MAEVQLTAAQRAAVEDRGGALLVSAAAGSGKTKVLVDRLMGQICDPVHPRDVNEFLIITYTKAAAAELRGKISAELGRRLAAQPANRHLQRQMNLIYITEISTVHAFCANLLRSYAHVLDLAADFRVAEEAECRLLRERCLDTVLESAYARLDQDPALRAMVDTLGQGRDDRGAAGAVETLYQAALCHPYPEDWLDMCERALDLSGYSGCADTPWGAYLLHRFRGFLTAQIAAMERAAAEMQGIPALEKAYLPGFQETIRHLRRLLELEQWDEIGTELPASFGRLSPVRNFEDKMLLERLKAVRSRCLDGLKDWRSVFYGTDRQTMDDLGESAQALLGALSLTRRLMLEFSAEKRRRRLMDFSDLEHEAIRLLIDRSSGRPTAAAREVAERFAEILVDEYQDSNEVQEKIFSAISRENRNRFMVGDVKQSIYRFRLADPSIFLDQYKRYGSPQTAAEGEPRKILLSDNFRSRPEILSAVNDVFRTVMSEEVGDLAYGAEEALRPGLSFPPAAEPVVELHCLEPSAESADGAVHKGRTEAQFVAERIVQLLSEGIVEETGGPRPVRPEDIVILLRSVHSAAPDYMEALRARGIPCLSDRGESILDTREVETLVSILQTIDNPHRDIPLVSALGSPVFGFTAEELAQIRACRRDGDFYGALCEAAAHDMRVSAFLRQLEELREQARWRSLHELLQLVFERTRIEAIFGAMDPGKRRQSNLQSFFSYAAGYHGSGSAALMQLLNDVELRRRQGQAIPPAEQGGGGAVQIMSIHKSKGLEFPIVILADLSRRFNAEDLRQNVMTHPELLVGSNLVDLEHGVRFPTIGRRAIAMRLQQESLSEELRVLYVAMTRAKNRLIMTYCSRFIRSELQAIAAEAEEPVMPEFAGRVKNAGMWVLAAAVCRTEAGELFAAGACPRQSTVREFPWRIRFHEGRPQAAGIWMPEEHGGSQESRACFPLDRRELSRRLAYRYPYPDASRVPSKLTATQLKGREMDREALSDAAELTPLTRRKLRRPLFVTASGMLTPAEQGTANHLFLQFACYAACTTAEGIEQEIRRMLLKEFLTPEQAAAVRRREILQLFHAPLGRKILSCSHVVREMKFSILVDGSIYDRSVTGEKIMLQGVVDCLLLEPDGLTVIDFKTDSVSPGREAERAARYTGQLKAYSMALERIYRQPVCHRLLYFLSTGCAVEIP